MDRIKAINLTVTAAGGCKTCHSLYWASQSVSRKKRVSQRQPGRVIILRWRRKGSPRVRSKKSVCGWLSVSTAIHSWNDPWTADHRHRKRFSSQSCHTEQLTWIIAGDDTILLLDWLLLPSPVRSWRNLGFNWTVNLRANKARPFTALMTVL